MTTLRGTNLRYALTRLLQLFGPSSVSEHVDGLTKWGFTVEGRPSKTVSDALRWEMGRARVWRIGRGRYRYADAPRSTEHRIIRRVAQLRKEALSLEAGQKSGFPDQRRSTYGQNR